MHAVLRRAEDLTLLAGQARFCGMTTHVHACNKRVTPPKQACLHLHDKMPLGMTRAATVQASHINRHSLHIAWAAGQHRTHRSLVEALPQREAGDGSNERADEGHSQCQVGPEGERAAITVALPLFFDAARCVVRARIAQRIDDGNAEHEGVRQAPEHGDDERQIVGQDDPAHSLCSAGHAAVSASAVAWELAPRSCCLLQHGMLLAGRWQVHMKHVQAIMVASMLSGAEPWSADSKTALLISMQQHQCMLAVQALHGARDDAMCAEQQPDAEAEADAGDEACQQRQPRELAGRPGRLGFRFVIAGGHAICSAIGRSSLGVPCGSLLHTCHQQQHSRMPDMAFDLHISDMSLALDAETAHVECSTSAQLAELRSSMTLQQLHIGAG